MTKKQIEKALENLPKPKYLYQRYNGIITKLEEIKENVYIDCATGISTDMNDYAFLGKTSENILDLLEVGDIFTYTSNVKGNSYKFVFRILNLDDLKMIKGNTYSSDIATILTHEQYDRNCFTN